ncbi:MAG TPA: hypothetical protein VHK28_11215, partial [Candidatus Limnocylindria bacterium]|nr:hypothetical protein [Candidatus Limnocylindria bacterium]
MRIPELLDIARDSLWTNVAIGDVPNLLALGNRVSSDSIGRYQFWPPEIPQDLTDGGIARIRQMVAGAFPPTAASSGASGSATAKPSPAPADGC